MQFDYLGETEMEYHLELKHKDKSLVEVSNGRLVISAELTTEEENLIRKIATNFSKLMSRFAIEILNVEKMNRERDVILSGGTNGSEFVNKKPE